MPNDDAKFAHSLPHSGCTNAQPHESHYFPLLKNLTKNHKSENKLSYSILS